MSWRKQEKARMRVNGCVKNQKVESYGRTLTQSDVPELHGSHLRETIGGREVRMSYFQLIVA